MESPDTNCVTPIGTSKAKHQDPMEIPHDFLSPLEIPLLFLLTHGISNSIFYFFNAPGNNMSSASPIWSFSGKAHSCSHSISVRQKILLKDWWLATWLYLVTGKYCARKVHINVMKNKTVVDNERDKENPVMMKGLIFNFAFFCYVCFETLEVGFGLYLTNKIIKNREIIMINLLFFD